MCSTGGMSREARACGRTSPTTCCGCRWQSPCMWSAPADQAVLQEVLPFLSGGQVPEGREDLYETPSSGPAHASVYEHGARAIDHSLRTGVHGLPLMGTGDWNDGMNRVGDQGRGESVWLAWFLCEVVRVYVPLAQAHGEHERAQRWLSARAGWVQALEAQAWDGAWYRRAFFDDGSPLGAAANPEARIDLIAQAWAVLSAAGDPARARQAMASADDELFDGEARLARLLWPPLQHAQPSAGYIQAYPPGVRENGGQYNHGAVWALMAHAQLGHAGAAWRYFQALSPAHRWAHPQLGPQYAIEPYVMAGDVYTAEPYIGRGGWSWYTGSAGWLLRAGLEQMLGVTVVRQHLVLRPCLPPHWPQATVTPATAFRPGQPAPHPHAGGSDALQRCPAPACRGAGAAARRGSLATGRGGRRHRVGVGGTRPPMPAAAMTPAAALAPSHGPLSARRPQGTARDQDAAGQGGQGFALGPHQVRGTSRCARSRSSRPPARRPGRPGPMRTGAATASAP